MALIVFSGLGAFDAVQPTSYAWWAAAAWWLVGAALVLTGLHAGRRAPARCLRWLATGAACLGVSVIRPVQIWLLSHTIGNAVEFPWLPAALRVDLGTGVSIGAPLAAAAVCAVLAHYAYAIHCDAPTPRGAIYGQAPAKPAKPDDPARRTEQQIFWSTAAAAVIGTALQSVALEDYFFRVPAEPLPTFSADGDRGAFALEGISPDGRMIRLALVAVDDALTTPPLKQTFPTAGTEVPRWPAGQKYERKPPSEVLPSDVCRGEVWIHAAPDGPRAWSNYPGGDLEIQSTAPGRVVCRIRRATADDDEAPALRLVALVYSRRRSPSVAALANPNRFSSTFEGTNANSRVLAGTLSPFVRPVWGPVFANVADIGAERSAAGGPLK